MEDNWEEEICAPSVAPDLNYSVSGGYSGTNLGRGRGFAASNFTGGGSNIGFQNKGNTAPPTRPGRDFLRPKYGSGVSDSWRRGTGNKENEGWSDDDSSGAPKGQGGWKPSRGGSDAPRGGGFGESGRGGCYKCNQSGHIARDCPNSESKGGGFRPGHTARDFSRTSEDVDGTKMKPKENYIPPDITSDERQLFDEGITTGINFDKYEKIAVSVSGDDVPFAIDSFEESGLRPLLQKNVKKSHYIRPTPVQKHAIPIIMASRDLMACSQTGSGKTAAFLLPIINNLLAANIGSKAGMKPMEPECVVMSPTRELAIQTHAHATKFAYESMVKTVVTYGGTSVWHQTQQIMRGCSILVATPGRLLDFIDRGIVSFSSLQYLVLDEADRMLDMGFMPDIKRMVEHCTMPPKGKRQTLMFSATFPEDVQRIATEFLNSYIFLTVGLTGGACSDVTQTFIEVQHFGKRAKLEEVLTEIGSDKTLVFVETKRTADFLAAFLSQNGFPTTSIHGDRLQREREEALGDFKSGRMPILVATAVAARGLDIKNVAHVVNYDLPSTADEYVHRIGRTGRVGNTGRATSFFDKGRDEALAQALVKILSDSQQEIPDWLGECARGGYGQTFSSVGRFGGRDIRKFGGSNGPREKQFVNDNSVNSLEEDDAW